MMMAGIQSHDLSLERIAGAMERIADALEPFEPDEQASCQHPESEREVHPNSTMSRAWYRCKACGEDF
jgi:hypothetical protein